jgi:hypothetical protein
MLCNICDPVFVHLSNIYLIYADMSYYFWPFYLLFGCTHVDSLYFVFLMVSATPSSGELLGLLLLVRPCM